jgi:peptidyl-prolyl cis-trans isomerase SurA
MTSKHTRTTSVGHKATPFASPSIRSIAARAATLFLVAAVPAAAFAQTASQRGFGGTFPNAPTLQVPQLPTPTAITPNGKVVEDVIARINDQIITRSEYERSQQQMVEDAQRQNASPADLQASLQNLLRDMIDAQLLISKGKELGISCDSETIRQLDEIRKQNHLADMEALEKAAAQQGVSFEDFKQNIRNQCIRQSVVRDEVGRHLNLTRGQEQAYYTAHSKDFEVPEQFHLSEILIPTPENATDAQLAQAEAKANDVAAQLKAGAKFADLAKTTSGGPTAAAGGDLGDFKRGTLGQVLEDATFVLPVGGNTAPIRTRQGYVILHVDSHQAAGLPPLESVRNQVEEAIYVEQLQPALRAYLTKARQDAYMEVAPGFVDTGSTTGKANNSNFAYTAYTPPAVKRKIQTKQRLEQEKAAKAQAALAAARERVAEKQAAKAEADSAKLGGVKNVSAKKKVKRVPREKIRYGQAPRNSLPAATVATTETPSAPVGGQAAGVAMAPTESVTSITTGVGAEAANNDDPLAPVEGPVKKTRYSAQQTQAEVDRAKSKLGKAETKATIRPVAATREQSATEKTQAAPLGLSGDTVKKKKKPKAQKGDKKERLQEQVKPVETPVVVAPTVNPAVTGTGITSNAPATPKSTPSADRTTLPPVSQGAPGTNGTGVPIPATTSAEPNQPATTPAPH